MDRFRRVQHFKNIYTISDYATELQSARSNSDASLNEIANRINTANIKYIY